MGYHQHQQKEEDEEERLTQRRQQRAAAAARVVVPKPHRRPGEKWHPCPLAVPAPPTSMPCRDVSGRNMSPLLVESPTPWARDDAASGKLEIPLPPPPALVLPPPTNRVSAGAQGRRGGGSGGHGRRGQGSVTLPPHRASSGEPVKKRARLSLPLPLPPSLASSSLPQARVPAHRSMSLDLGGVGGGSGDGDGAPTSRWLPPLLNPPTTSSSSASSSRASYWTLARSMSGAQPAGAEGRCPVTSAALSTSAWSGGGGDGEGGGGGGGGDARVFDALEGVLSALFPTREEARGQGQGEPQDQEDQHAQARRCRPQGQQQQQQQQGRQPSTRQLSLGSLLMSEDDELDCSSGVTAGRSSKSVSLQLQQTAAAAAAAVTAGTVTPMGTAPSQPRRRHRGHTGGAAPQPPHGTMARVSPVDDVLARTVSTESCATGNPDATYVSSSAPTSSASGVLSALTGGRIGSGGGGGGGWSGDGLLFPPPASPSASQAFEHQPLPFPLYRRTSDIATLMMTAASSSWAGPAGGGDPTEGSAVGGGRMVRGQAAATGATQEGLPRAVSLDCGNVENFPGGRGGGRGGDDDDDSSAASAITSRRLDCAAMANLRTPVTREASLMQAVEAAACPPAGGGGGGGAGGAGLRARLSREESLTRAMEFLAAAAPAGAGAGAGAGGEDGEAVEELVDAASLGDMDEDEVFGGVVAGADGFGGDVAVSEW